MEKKVYNLSEAVELMRRGYYMEEFVTHLPEKCRINYVDIHDYHYCQIERFSYINYCESDEGEEVWDTDSESFTNKFSDKWVLSDVQDENRIKGKTTDLISVPGLEWKWDESKGAYGGWVSIYGICRFYIFRLYIFGTPNYRVGIEIKNNDIEFKNHIYYPSLKEAKDICQEFLKELLGGKNE